MTHLHRGHARVPRSLGFLQAVPFRGTAVDVVRPGRRRHLAFAYLLLVEQIQAVTSLGRRPRSAAGHIRAVRPPTARAAAG